MTTSLKKNRMILFDSFCINQYYSIDALPFVHIYYAHRNASSAKQFSNILELYSDLKDIGLKSDTSIPDKRQYPRSRQFEAYSQANPNNTSTEKDAFDMEENKPSESDPFEYGVFYAKTAIVTFCNSFFESDGTVPIDASEQHKLEQALTAHLLHSRCFNSGAADTLVHAFICMATTLLADEEGTNKEIDRSYNDIKHSIKAEIQACLMKGLFNSSTLALFQFWGQIVAFAYQACNKNVSKDTAEGEALLHLASYTAAVINKTGCIPDSYGLQMALDSLAVEDPHERFCVFDTVSCLAQKSYGGKQLAYDACFTWISGKPKGLIRTYLDNRCNFMKKKKERVWRQSEAGQNALAIMHRNKALVSLFIQNRYDLSSACRRKFNNIAYHDLLESLKIKNDFESCMLFSSTFLDGSRIDSSDSQYQIGVFDDYFHRCTSQTAEERARLSMAYCNLIAYNLLSELYHLFVPTQEGDRKNQDFSISSWLKEQEGWVSILAQILKLISGDPREGDACPYLAETDISFSPDFIGFDCIIPDISRLRDFTALFLISEGEDRNQLLRTEDGAMTICSLLLLLIRCTSTMLSDQLKRYDYYNSHYYTRDEDFDFRHQDEGAEKKQIVYYTTISTAQYLFDNLIRNDANHEIKVDNNNSSGKNCLTVLHARSMNDPHEGLTLLEAINLPDIFSPLSEVQVREDMYKEQYVFLKSFTERIDQLVMWNRYASDYDENGKNSNGCCIELDPEVFEQLSNPPADKEGSQITDASPLYRVVYLSSSNRIEEKSNPDIKRPVIVLFEMLKKLVEELGNQVQSSKIKDKKDVMGAITSSLYLSLQKIMYLFKSDYYADECESRIIYTRRYNQVNSIRLLSGSPQKLAINPFVQIYIKRIILGPNVKDPDGWKPYFQFQLNKMWGKRENVLPEDQQPVYNKYTIELSKIHYRT